MFWERFEHGTSRIQVISVTLEPRRSMRTRIISWNKERLRECTLQTDDSAPICAPAALRPLDGRADWPYAEASQLFKTQMELLILSLQHWTALETMDDGREYYAIGWEGVKPSNCTASSTEEGTKFRHWSAVWVRLTRVYWIAFLSTVPAIYITCFKIKKGLNFGNEYIHIPVFCMILTISIAYFPQTTLTFMFL